MEDIFDSSVRSANDLAGVFEFDGETSYFYLYKIDEASGNKVLDSIRIAIGDPAFSEEDIKIVWNADETIVSLVIIKTVWAVFDTAACAKYGGDYRQDAQPDIPHEVIVKI